MYMENASLLATFWIMIAFIYHHCSNIINIRIKSIKHYSFLHHFLFIIGQLDALNSFNNSILNGLIVGFFSSYPFLARQPFRTRQDTFRRNLVWAGSTICWIFWSQDMMQLIQTDFADTVAMENISFTFS
jgi:hypothetical protein